MLRNKLYILILFTFAINSCKDFGPKPLYEKGFIKYYGGAQSDVSEVIKITSDGGYIMIGSTDSYSASGDIYVLKVDKEGNFEWETVLGAEGTDKGTNLIETAGGFMLVGSIEKNNLEYIYVAKIDANGDTLWTKTLNPGLANYKNAIAYDIEESYDKSGYIIAGKITDDINQIEKAIILNIDKNGILQGKPFEPYGYIGQNVNSYAVYERKVNGKSVYDFLGNATKKNATDISAYSMIVISLNDVGNARDALLKTDPRINQTEIQFGFEMKTTQGGYIIVGTSINSSNNEDIYLLKLTENFDKVWFKTYDFGKSDVGVSVSETTDGGYVVGGKSVNTNKQDDDAFVMKVSSTGEVEWKKYFGGTNRDYTTSVIQANDGGYVALCTLGLSTSVGPDNTITIIKMDNKGDIVNK
ncbi:MAG: hypothetical protein NW207_09250 [Cytophagales bacterium]|nr:hypothetical protein [Cytophagales bacterium]